MNRRVMTQVMAGTLASLDNGGDVTK